MTYAPRGAGFAASQGTPASLRTRLERVWPQVQQTLVELAPQPPRRLATGDDPSGKVHVPELTIGAIRLLVGRIVHG
ncbi:hypothetical protein [Streptomyces sp. NPDC050564]|uniref:hypothetical protein n=1 Tax=Streptomyces sp. NPDC050564 TaxID=3365631 RepID=UPI0037B61126